MLVAPLATHQALRTLLIRKALSGHATNPQRAGRGASGSPEHFPCWPSRFSAPSFRIPGCGWSSCSGTHAEPQSSPPCTPAFHSKSSMCWLDAGGLRKACSCVQVATDLHAGADPGLKTRVLLDQVLATVCVREYDHVLKHGSSVSHRVGQSLTYSCIVKGKQECKELERNVCAASVDDTRTACTDAARLL